MTTNAKIWNLKASEQGDALELWVTGVIDSDFGGADDTGSAALGAKLREYASAKTIGVRINSLGGSLPGGVAVYNLLRAHGAEVTTYVDGVAASAASVIAMAGKRIVMGQGAMMMVHLPQAATFGDA